VLHHASTREFLHEFIGHYVALEGKLWGSLKRLIFQPGELTNEYIRGRRVRYVQPLRLYLTFSVLFFALLKFTGGESDGQVDIQTTTAKVMAPVSELAQNVGEQQAVWTSWIRPPRKASPPPRGAGGHGQGNARRRRQVRCASGRSGKTSAAKVVNKAAEAKKDSADSDNLNEEYIERKLMAAAAARQWHIQTLPPDEQVKTFKNGMNHYAPYAIFC
jgi:hypothetical protein